MPRAPGSSQPDSGQGAVTETVQRPTDEILRAGADVCEGTNYAHSKEGCAVLVENEVLECISETLLLVVRGSHTIEKQCAGDRRA
jgi:hypothetical protein